MKSGVGYILRPPKKYGDSSGTGQRQVLKAMVFPQKLKALLSGEFYL